MQFDTVFERTDAGIAEIHRKSNRLTQSERLVLIMTDGRTDIATLIEKLPSLSMPRVFRAITKLQDLGLMSQQLVAPVGSGTANDAIAPEVVERFLEQTDLDPATIIRAEADDFSPTTLPPGASLKDPTAPVRADTELERRLKALMGETPKFARPDAPPLPAAAAPAPQAPPLPIPVPPSPARPIAPLPEVAPEEVVRAARQQAQKHAPISGSHSAPLSAPIPAAFNPKTTGAVKPGERFDVPMPQRTRTQHVPVPPTKQSSWPLYILMAVGAALVAFALLRVLLK